MIFFKIKRNDQNSFDQKFCDEATKGSEVPSEETLKPLEKQGGPIDTAVTDGSSEETLKSPAPHKEEVSSDIPDAPLDAQLKTALFLDTNG